MEERAVVCALRRRAGIDRHHGHGIYDSPHRRGRRVDHPHGGTDPRRRHPRPFRSTRHGSAGDRSPAGDWIRGGDAGSVVDGEMRMEEKKSVSKQLLSTIIFISICWLSAYAFSRLFLPIPKVCTKEQRGDWNLLDISEVEPVENRVHTVGHIGGEASSVFTSVDHVFVKFGLELAAFDVSNPTRIHRDGYLLIPGDLIYIDQDRQYAYVHHKGLWKVDISDPANMSAAHVSYPQGYIESIKIVNNSAFLTTVHCEYISIGFGSRIPTGCRKALHIVNILNPERATWCIGGIPGSLLRLALGASRELVDNFQKNDEANGLFYTVSEKEGLQVFDAPPMLQTTAIYSYSPPLELVDVMIYGSNAFITKVSHDPPNLYWDLHLINILDPENPLDVGHLVSRSRLVAVVDHYGFIEQDGETKSMKVIDLQNPTLSDETAIPPDLAEISQRKHGFSPSFIDIEGREVTRLPNGMFIEGDVLYSFYSHVDIKDISNFTWVEHYPYPDPIGHYKLSTRESVNDLVVKDKIAYISDRVGNLEIVDFSDPENPRLITVYDSGEWLDDLHIVDSFLFATASRDGFFVIDISNPKSPAVVGSYVTGTFISSFTIVCPYIYITDSENGLFVLQSDFLTISGCK